MTFSDSSAKLMTNEVLWLFKNPPLFRKTFQVEKSPPCKTFHLTFMHLGNLKGESNSPREAIM